MLIIFEKIICCNECNFRFTDIEAARIITSALRSLMENLLFQWSRFPNIPNGNRRSMHDF
jgi:hypothetical protein